MPQKSKTPLTKKGLDIMCLRGEFHTMRRLVGALCLSNAELRDLHDWAAQFEELLLKAACSVAGTAVQRVFSRRTGDAEHEAAVFNRQNRPKQLGPPSVAGAREELNRSTERMKARVQRERASKDEKKKKKKRDRTTGAAGPPGATVDVADDKRTRVQESTDGHHTPPPRIPLAASALSSDDDDGGGGGGVGADKRSAKRK
jgi:hypothetical protein